MLVVPGGFCWQGTTYDSLSTIAKKITGTSWNGPRFFGLRSKKMDDLEEEHAGNPASVARNRNPQTSSLQKSSRRPGRRSSLQAAVSGDAGGGS